MANIIKLKRSETAGSSPASGDLEVGEVCMNLVDGILYTKKIDGTIVTVAQKNGGMSSLELVSLDTGSSAGPDIDLFRDSFSPFDSDELGKIDFSGENDSSDKKVFAKIVSKISDATSSTEDGELELHVIKNGTVTNVATIKSDGIHFSAGNGLYFSDGTSIVSSSGHFNTAHSHTMFTVDGTVGETSTTVGEGTAATSVAKIIALG